MERKYYLRGLGIGIAVTAVIMGMFTSHGRKMTDQEIIARARELGMVENTVLADIADPEDAGAGVPEAAEKPETAEPADTAGQTDKMPPVKEPEDAKEPEADPAKQDQAPESAGKPENGSSADESALEEPKEPEDVPEEAEESDVSSAATGAKRITINKGDGSHTVARKLAEAGAVKSADDFDRFLCEKGYDKKLHTGTFSIPAGAGEEQIARIVTGAEE